MTDKKTPSENIKEDQGNLVNTLESIRILLEQNETKLSAARASISIANANTKHDTSALLNMRTGTHHEQIVPILDDIVEIELSTNSLDKIPELDSIFNEPEIDTQFAINVVDDPAPDDIVLQDNSIPVDDDDMPVIKPDLATLTAKNLIIDALDDLQMDMEESLRESLMKTMVILEKDLKLKISQKIEVMKAELSKK